MLHAWCRSDESGRRLQDYALLDGKWCAEVRIQPFDRWCGQVVCDEVEGEGEGEVVGWMERCAGERQFHIPVLYG